MSNPNVIVGETTGLNSHGNELSAPIGSTSVADNVEFNRERMPERRRGFKDYSTNLPDFAVEQLLVGSNGSDKYANLDGALWYYDGSNWLRKRTSGDNVLLYNPRRMAIYGGHLYYSDRHAIFDINISTGTRSVLAGRFGVTGTTDSTGDAARFNTPIGLCTDGTNLYVCDSANSTIRKIVISTGVVTTFAGTAGATGSTDASGTSARFQAPNGICTDGTNLYVTDNAPAYTVRKITISGAAVTTIAGTYGTAGSLDGTGSGSTRFQNPLGLCADSGNLYVCDGEAGNNIRKIVISSTVVTTFAGSTAGLGGDTDGTGTAARFYGPSGITVLSGSLYVAERVGYKVRKVVISTAAVSSFVGPAGSLDAGTTDGFGTAAKFSTPVDVISDGSALYVTDYDNSTIRRVYPTATSGYVVTFAGIPGHTASSVNASQMTSVIVGPS